jgi:putative transposase
MGTDGVFRRRRLPHWDVEGKPVFITACLKGSIPSVGMSRIRGLRNELNQRQRPDELNEQAWGQRKEKLVFELIEELLDDKSPVLHLREDQQASVVQNAILHFAEQRYRLLAFAVMPSHYHWMFLPNEEWSAANANAKRTPREIISHSIQSYTATMCNRVRGEDGSYWQDETYDHWPRNEDDIYRIIDYIESNPVKAGLVVNPEDWPWSSARIRAEKGLYPGDAIT